MLDFPEAVGSVLRDITNLSLLFILTYIGWRVVFRTETKGLLRTLVGCITVALVTAVLTSPKVIHFVESFDFLWLLSQWWLLFPCIAAAIGLYALRQRAPLVYGAFELLVSIMAISLAIQGTSKELLPKALAIVAGVYIFVPGLENCASGRSKKPTQSE